MTSQVPAFHSIAVVLAASLATAAAAQTPPDAAALRTLSGSCANCHGTHGRSAGAMPGLAGTPKSHMVEQMRMFRDGRRPATVMHQLARGYTDEQIDALAEHFAQQRATGGR